MEIQSSLEGVIRPLDLHGTISVRAADEEPPVRIHPGDDWYPPIVILVCFALVGLLLGGDE